MQIVEIPRENGEYEKTDDKSRLDIVTAEDHVRVATLFEVHREDLLDIYLSKKGIAPYAEAEGEGEVPK